VSTAHDQIRPKSSTVLTFYPALYGSKYLQALLNSKDSSMLTLSPSKTLDNLYAAGLMHPSREHSRQATTLSEKESKDVAMSVTRQTNTNAQDVMLLKRWNGKLLAEQFGLPGMELEIERAVEQVQKTIEEESKSAREIDESDALTTEKLPLQGEKR
jgi:hypothetical protein